MEVEGKADRFNRRVNGQPLKPTMGVIAFALAELSTDRCCATCVINACVVISYAFAEPNAFMNSAMPTTTRGRIHDHLGKPFIPELQNHLS